MSNIINSNRNLITIELNTQAKGYISFLSEDPSLNTIIKDFRYSYTRASNFFKKEFCFNLFLLKKIILIPLKES